MDCARFENELVEVMALPDDAADRRERLDRLREHARLCPECSGTVALVDLLAIPVVERDPGEDPGAAYWASFDRRLRDRIRREENRPNARRRSAWAIVAAAAVFAVALASLWVLDDRDGVRPPGAKPPGVHADLPLPDDLETWLAQADPETAERDLDSLVGVEADAGFADLALGVNGEAVTDAGEDDGCLFPPLDDLDAEGQRQLLEWLRAENDRLQGGSA